MFENKERNIQVTVNFVSCLNVTYLPYKTIKTNAFEFLLQKISTFQNCLNFVQYSFLSFRHLLLSCISLGMASTRPELQAVTGKTLMAVQKERLQVDIKKLTDKAITDLFKLGALLDASDTEGDSIQNVTLDLNVSVCKT